MSGLLNILGAAPGADDGTIQIVVIVVMMVVGLISSAIQKARAKAAQQEAQRRKQQESSAPAAPAAPPPPQASQTPVRAPTSGRVQNVQQVQIATPQAGPVRLPSRRGQSPQETPIFVPPTAAPHRRAPTDEPVIVLPHEEQVHQTVLKPGAHADISGIDAEIERLRERTRRLQTLRGKRLAAMKPAEADSSAIEARILHVPAAPRSGRPGTITFPVYLNTSDAIRHAVVYRELLGAPKALREEAEFWEV
jgi:hypothetical protein